jgi:hypothetical protein
MIVPPFLIVTFFVNAPEGPLRGPRNRRISYLHNIQVSCRIANFLHLVARASPMRQKTRNGNEIRETDMSYLGILVCDSYRDRDKNLIIEKHLCLIFVDMRIKNKENRVKVFTRDASRREAVCDCGATKGNCHV